MPQLSTNTMQHTNDENDRIIKLYNTLNAELDTIEQEINHLRLKIHKIIDKKRMYTILKDLNDAHH